MRLRVRRGLTYERLFKRNKIELGFLYELSEFEVIAQCASIY